MKAMKAATAYLRKGRFFVHALFRTTDGVWIFAEPCEHLDLACSDRELGDLIQQALDGSRTGVPHPRVWTGLLGPLLKRAGVRSWNAFAKSASCAGVEEALGTVSVTPTRNLGAKGGFVDDRSRSEVVARGAPEELGHLARRLLLSPIRADNGDYH